MDTNFVCILQKSGKIYVIVAYKLCKICVNCEFVNRLILNRSKPNSHKDLDEHLRRSMNDERKRHLWIKYVTHLSRQTNVRSGWDTASTLIVSVVTFPVKPWLPCAVRLAGCVGASGSELFALIGLHETQPEVWAHRCSLKQTKHGCEPAGLKTSWTNLFFLECEEGLQLKRENKILERGDDSSPFSCLVASTKCKVQTVRGGSEGR